MNATIADVAARAGVSTTTVSRVLAGSAQVAPATRARVLSAVETLAYRPSAIARSLRQQSTATLGVVVTDLTNPFFPELVQAVERVAHDAGFAVLLSDTGTDPARERQVLDLLVSRRVDGIAVIDAGLATRHRDHLRELPIRTVLLNTISDDPAVPAVRCDDRQGAGLSLAHLAELGHDRVVHLAGPPAADGTAPRTDAVREAAAAHQLDLTVIERDGTFQGGESAARVLADQELPLAVTTHNDVTAIGLLHGLHARGIAVPADVSIVGFDDIAVSAYLAPPLTTVRQDPEAMGTRTVALLTGSEPEGPATHELPVTLQVRGSTSTPGR